MTLAAVLALLGLAGCAKQKSVQAANPAGAERPPAPVVVAQAVQQDVPVEIIAIGNVEPYQAVQIRSQVTGQLQRVYFKEGEDVRQGQLLFTLDKAPFRAALEQAESILQKDEASAANLKAQAARYTSLEQQGIISREQAEQMRTQAQASVATMNADKAAVDAARVQLGYTDIRAPINARTGALLINVGNQIKANDTPYLVQLNQITPIYVTFSVPEKNLDQVRRYMGQGKLRALAYPKGQRTNPSAGTLSFIDNTVDPATGTFKMKATFTNTDRKLWPGEFVDVVLGLSTVKNAIVVPTKAIQSGQQGNYVYVVGSGNVAQSRAVETAGAYHDLTIVAKGVQPGEAVIVEGQLGVAPNSKVLVQSTLPTQAAPGPARPAGGGGE